MPFWAGVFSLWLSSWLSFCPSNHCIWYWKFSLMNHVHWFHTKCVPSTWRLSRVNASVYVELPHSLSFSLFLFLSFFLSRKLTNGWEWEIIIIIIIIITTTHLELVRKKERKNRRVNWPLYNIYIFWPISLSILFPSCSFPYLLRWREEVSLLIKYAAVSISMASASASAPREAAAPSSLSAWINHVIAKISFIQLSVCAESSPSSSRAFLERRGEKLNRHPASWCHLQFTPNQVFANYSLNDQTHRYFKGGEKGSHTRVM